MGVSFVDTSILCNILPVPGRDQHRSEVLAEFAALRERGETFILPMTAVVETGNFIAQLGNGSVRRTTATIFSSLLELVARGDAPWILHQFEWREDYLRALVSGASTAHTLVEHFVNGLGGGDLCILTERDIYRQRSGLRSVRIWTRDGGLAAHN